MDNFTYVHIFDHFVLCPEIILFTTKTFVDDNVSMLSYTFVETKC